MGIGRRRWLASERVAFRLLEERGFNIIDTHKKIEIDGVEVGEVDAVAVGPDGSKYVVEVKAGRLDVHGVRQVYTAAQLLGAKPLAVAKGYADDSARKLAEKLGVELVELEDVFLVDAEELETLVYGAVMEAVAEALSLLASPPQLPPNLVSKVMAIAEAESLGEAAKRLNMKPSDLRDAVTFLKQLSPLARKGGWRGLKLTARLLIAGLGIRAALDSLTDTADKLAELKQALAG